MGELVGPGNLLDSALTLDSIRAVGNFQTTSHLYFITIVVKEWT